MDDFPWRDEPGSQWGWHITTNPNVDFCVQALLADGLRVAPFDRHPAGDQHLQRAGLTPEQWLTWLASVCNEDARLQAELRWPSWRRSSEWPPSRESLNAILPAPRSALELWQGAEAVRAALVDLYALPREHGSAEVPHPPAWRSDGLVNFQSLWLRFLGRVPNFTIYVTHYPGVVVHTVPPASIVMGHRVVLNEAMFRPTVERALEELARANVTENPMSGSTAIS